jgi:hypothetical protein
VSLANRIVQTVASQFLEYKELFKMLEELFLKLTVLWPAKLFHELKMFPLFLWLFLPLIQAVPAAVTAVTKSFPKLGKQRL